MVERHIEDSSPGMEFPYEKRKLRELRNRWLAELDVPLKNERLFELEMYLKVLDRFCNLRNHPISDPENVFDRDLKVETHILRDAITRVISLVQSLLPEEKTSAFNFQRYVEHRLMSDRVRMERLERSLMQNIPEESLFVLESGMTSLREMASAFLSSKKVSYLSFHHLGDLVSREIAWNAFFNPFHMSEFSSTHDRIRNAAIQKIVRTKIPASIRREISVVFLIVFRLLHYVQYIREEDSNHWVLLQNLPVFTLVRSEGASLIEYLENDLTKTVKKKLERDEAVELVKVFDSLAFQLSVEIKKVYQLEIQDAAAEKEINRLRTGMARGKGVLVEILRQVVVQLARAFDHSVEGNIIFRDFISRTALSLKLRKDVWIFHRVVEHLDKSVSSNLPKSEFKPIFEALKSLRNYVYYFQNVSFQMVRFTDRDAFEDFFRVVDGFSGDSVQEPGRLEELHQIVRAFSVFLETTLTNISQRSELKDQPFGTREGEYILEQFLK